MKRYRGGQPLAWRLEFKPQDLWVGVFWKRGLYTSKPYVDIWICLIPMFPLHLLYEPRRKEQFRCLTIR